MSRPSNRADNEFLPVENIGSLRFFSIAHERHELAIEKKSALLARGEIGIEQLKGEKIISFSR